MATFTLTANDLIDLRALVDGRPLDEAVTGVRELSGQNNNLRNPTYAAADQPFLRLTETRYGAPLANGNLAVNPVFADLDPRAISNMIGAQEPDLARASSGVSMLFSAFGQYFAHGLDFVKKGGSGTIEIGGPGTLPAPGSNNPADLTRATVAGYDANGTPLHSNSTAAYVDQNQAYGSNALVGIFLRETDGAGGTGAHLSMGAADPSAPGFLLLPTLRKLIQQHWQNDTRFTADGIDTTFRTYYAGLVDDTGVIDSAIAAGLARDFMGSGQSLLLDTNPFINPLDHVIAGDGRTNENVSLTAVHTIWARNHNFHVENLRAAGFDGDISQLFEAAKIINEAEYQRVVFTEFADTLLGGIRGLGSHGWNGYNPDANAGISEEFAAAAYRVGHSMIGDTLRILKGDGTTQDIKLFDAFLNPSNNADVFTLPLATLQTYGYDPQPGYAQLGVSAIIGGTALQAAEEIDANVVDAARNDLTRQPADLFSFNLARGRDVGLGTLNQVRAQLTASGDPYVSEAVGFAGDLTPYRSWEDFQLRNSLSDALISQFRAAYPDLVLTTPDQISQFAASNPDIILQNGNTVKGIDRVDLWLGGISEAHINGGVVGQTFWVILHEQLDRLQEGDRFYYLDRLDDFDLYDANIDGGAGEGFSTIIERNTGLTGLAEDAFQVPWKTNTAPQIDRGVADQTVVERQSFAFTVPADAFRDADQGEGDQLTWSAKLANGDPLPDWLTFNPSNRSLAGTPPEGLNGTLDIRVTVRDTFNTSASDTFLLVVQPYYAHLIGTARADKLGGTARPDHIEGLAGNDKIDGRAGDDKIDGGAGNDELVGGAGNDDVSGGLGDDKVLGGDGDDVLHGGDGRDALTGGNGNDVLIGGIGVDTLSGGAGADIFRFISANESPRQAGTAKRDVITDFDPVVDKVDLSAIDADTTVDGNQAFTFIGGLAFSGTAGQLRYAAGILAADVNGDRIADLEIQLIGRPNLYAYDILG